MYLNVVELAESFGVDESVVENWTRREGLPHVIDRGRMLFDRRQVISWAASRGLAAKAGFLAEDRSVRSLEPLLRAGGIWRDIPANEVLDVLVRVVGNIPGTSPAVRQLLTQRLRAPGGVTWAPVGRGLALPHLRTPVALGRESGILSLLILREPLAMGEPAPDNQPVTRLFFFIAPSPRAHLELLGQLSAKLARGNLRPLALEGAPDDQIFAAVAEPDRPRETPK